METASRVYATRDHGRSGLVEIARNGMLPLRRGIPLLAPNLRSGLKIAVALCLAAWALRSFNSVVVIQREVPRAVHADRQQPSDAARAGQITLFHRSHGTNKLWGGYSDLSKG